jgi:FimV-like protein
VPPVPEQPSETPGTVTASPAAEAALPAAQPSPLPTVTQTSDAPSPAAVTGVPWIDRLLAHPFAEMGLLILAVLGFAGLWLVLLARRGRRVARQQPEVAPVVARAPLQASATQSAADDPQRADPWLKMSELERAIGGRFELPDLDMGTPQPAPPSTARPPEGGLNQQLARSLELAAACLRRNEVDRARRLLEDVVRSGDETQREFARALLSRLG